jgi:hypothetical protein
VTIFLRYLFFITCLVLAGCGTNTKKAIPSLRETYAKNDKNPFGSYIAYRQLGAMYPQHNVRVKAKAFDKTWNDIADTNAIYVCISQNLLLSEEEAISMLNYVYAGNTLFIAANYIDTTLLSQAKCKGNSFYAAMFKVEDSLRSTQTTAQDIDYNYFYQPFSNSLTYKDSVFTKVLGVNDKGEPNYLLYYHGKGKLLLHCDPRAFSNYFLLKQDNYKYLATTLGYAGNEPDHVYWDDHYNKTNYRRRSKNSNDDDNSFSTLGEINKHESLRWAFWLSLLLLLLYILFGGKRRQRIMEVIKPNENTTVAFTETIGRLYLQKKDNKNIAEKMVTYFNEFVRNTYFVNTNNVTEEFIITLSRKSGVDKSRVESLYRAIQHVQAHPQIDDYQLLSLNEQIQQFYSHKS